MTAATQRVPSSASPLGDRITHAVYDYRFLTGPQIACLFSKDSRGIDTVLRRLVDAGYLAGVRRPVLDAESPDTVYALAQRGANLIAALLGTDRKFIRWRKYHNFVGLPFVEHRLAANDVRIALTVGLQSLGYSVDEWRYEVPIQEDVDDPDEGVPPLVIRPDAYLRCLAGARRIHFFLEVDMATETHARFAQKVRRYLAYKESRMFRYRFGGRSFRVLVVASTVTRVRSLKRITESQAGQRMFWFARVEDVAAEGIAQPVWQLAGEDTMAGLFGTDASRPQRIP